MTEDNRRLQRRLATQKPAAYEIGFGRPPKSGQFAKGKSGNPKGRPKGSKSTRPRLNEERLKEIILAEAYRTVKVREGQRDLTLSIAEAVMRSIALNAAKGKPRAQRLFTELLARTEREDKKLADEWLKTAIEYKLGWEYEFQLCRMNGVPLPEPLPHPDHIEIDMASGEVLIKGPFTPEDKVRWDALRQRKHECLTRIGELKQKLKRSRSPLIRKNIETEIEEEFRLFEQIHTLVPD